MGTTSTLYSCMGSYWSQTPSWWYVVCRGAVTWGGGVLYHHALCGPRVHCTAVWGRTGVRLPHDGTWSVGEQWHGVVGYCTIMHYVDHEYIVQLYGVVLKWDSWFQVNELAPLRSLLECLKEPALRNSFPVLTLCDFTSQIAGGMAYLENKRLIHRDLAARNILVFSRDKVSRMAADWEPFQYKDGLMGIPIIDIRRSLLWDHLIFIIGTTILIRRLLYIETTPKGLWLPMAVWETWLPSLTHSGRVTHVCLSELGHH